MKPTLGVALLFILLQTSSDGNGQTSAQPVTLTIAGEPRQTLDGFGCSMVGMNSSAIPAAIRTKMYRMVFGDLHMNVLRLWVDSGTDRTVEQMKQALYQTYVDTQIIAEARKQGVTTLLLAPARGEEKPTEPMTDYARKLAEVIQGVNSERGIHIHVTGIANEPGFTPSQLAEAARELRRQLDTRHLTSVKIIAPEAASADDRALAEIAGLKAAPDSWVAISGIATHSYNMAATKAFSDIIAGTSKQYWITEAADNGNEVEADVNLATSLSARFLNDLNHGVTHWIYFIGFADSPDVAKDNDNATKFLVYDVKTQRIFRPLKYDWFRQLRAAFPKGSRIYPVRTERGDDLVYTYGQKPMLNAAAARRPDGGWSLAAVNLTGVQPNTSISQWHPASALRVVWKIPRLKNVRSMPCHVFRSDATHRFVPAGRVTLMHGATTLLLHPGELITISSDKQKSVTSQDASE